MEEKKQPPEPYLSHDASGVLTSQVTRLLRDESTDNTALILSLLEGGGLNKRLLGYAFGLAVFHPSKPLATRAARLVEKSTSIETLRQMQKLKESVPYYYNEAEYLGKYSNTDFDLFDFLLAYKMCNWHRSEGNHSYNFLQAHHRLDLTFYPENVVTPAIATLDFVRHLSLPANKHFDLEASFPYLAELPLEMVLLENMRLEQFPVCLLTLPKLRTLSIKRGTSRPKNSMLVPEGGPFGSTSLEKILIENMPLSGTERLGFFPNLQEAFLVRCSLDTVNFLEKSTKLERLTLRYNHLETLPAFLGNLTELRSMDFSGNPFRNINLNLENLTKLEELELKLQIPRP